MLRSLSIFLLLLAAACTKTPPSNEGAPTGTTVGAMTAPPVQTPPKLQSAEAASSADVTILLDSIKETRKEGDVKLGQSFEISITGTPGVTWKASATDRSLGDGTPEATLAASNFLWTTKMSQMQVGDHTLGFDGSDGKKVTVVVHVK
jgi:hypothetical protein